MNHAPKKRIHSEEGESPIGFVMFGDLMSQLLCFFILLYVLASMNASKTEGNEYTDLITQFSASFKGAMEKKTQPAPPIVKKEDTKKEVLVESIKKMMIEAKLESNVDLIVEEKRIRLIFDQPLLYDSGEAVLKPDFEKMLTPVAKILQSIPNSIVVEGHTDNVPIHTNKYESNWVLSFHRAYSVVSFFSNKMKIDPQRISVMGYGEYRPRFLNDSPQHRDMNRRIEINIMTDAYQDPNTLKQLNQTSKTTPTQITPK